MFVISMHKTACGLSNRCENFTTVKRHINETSKQSLEKGGVIEVATRSLIRAIFNGAVVHERALT